jgi:hypothetical protein
VKFGGLLAHFSFEGSVDGEEGGVADFEVEDFAFSAGGCGEVGLGG